MLLMMNIQPRFIALYLYDAVRFFHGRQYQHNWVTHTIQL